MHGLRDKRVWISGASGELGSAMVETFLALGCHVVASARRRTRLMDLRAALHNHERLHIAENDTTDPRGVEALLDALWREQPLDLAVQCAGHFSHGPLSEASDADVEALVRTNLLGSAWLLRGCLRRMLAVGRGDIVLVAADKALEPSANLGFYGASKAAVAHLVEVANLEARGTSVRTWGLLPSALDTRANREAGMKAANTPLLSPSRVCADLVTVLTSGVDAERGRLVRLPISGAS